MFGHEYIKTIKKRLTTLCCFFIVCIFALSLPSQVIAIDYTASGIVVSKNFLPVSGSSLINSFEYTASSIPEGTSVRIQFSYDNVDWYNSSGSLWGWNTLSQGSNSIDFSALGWKKPYFYYKLLFNSNGSSTPVLDSVGLSFNSFDGTFYTYSSNGTLVSNNLLPTDGVYSINNFNYSISSLPTGSSIQLQFSEDGNSWYSSSGSVNTSDTLSVGTHTLNLAGLGWTGPYFYYRAIFNTSDTNNTPVLNLISLDYTSNNYYWVGDMNGSWNNSSNWSVVSGGPGGAGIPGVQDNAIFDGGDIDSVNIDTNINLKNITIRSGYTGSITQVSTSSIILSGTLTQSAGTLTLAGVNNVYGGVILNAGRLNINNSGSLGTSTLDLIGGDIDNTSGAPITLSTNNAQNWGENISFLGTNNLNLGTGNIIRNATTTITTNGTGTLTIGGIISGNWGLIKSGNGALTLDGVNTHTGKTILNAGTLNMSQSANIGTGIYEQNNGSLNIYGNNIINKILNISGGTIDIYDNTIFSGTINLSQGLAVNFHNNSYNKGIVNGNAKFSFADGGIASLTGTKVWGTVTGTAKGLLDDVVINHWVFNDSSYGNGTTTISQGKVMDFYDTSSNTGNLFVTAGGIVSFHDSSFNNGGNISVASGGTVHFYDSSFNVGGVSDVASGGLFDFYNYSFNNGVVNGNVVFNDDVSQNVGLINGSTTRQYNTDATTTRNFTNEGGHNDWIVIVQGVILDISNAIYSLVTNIFKSFNNGFFFFGSNSSGGPVIPQIIINQPLVGTSTIKWLPSVDWGNGTSTCQYKMDDGEYQNLDCSKNGSDISRPIAGMHTLFVRATDIKGNLTEKSIIFTYDNTVPVYTSCGTDLLDEETRPYYYLSSDIANDCHITVDTELRGGNFTIDGNVIANATSSGADGFDITISNITITGTTSAMGGDNNNGNGGNGGNITIATSTTGSVTTKGGNANLDGGHGGNISIINSRSNNSDNTIITNGGDSLSCGNGGNGGLVNIINSSYGLVTNSGGLSSQIGCSGSNKQPGSSGQINTVGAGYIPPYNPNDALSEADTLSRNSINKTQPAGSSNVLFNMLNNIIDPFTYKDIKQINPFAPDFKTSNLGNTVIPAIFKNFKTVPYVYFEQLTSMLLMNISKFLFTARPESVDYLINNNPELAKYLKLSSIKNEQDLVTLSTKNILLAKTDTENIPKGLFVIKSSGKDVPTYLTYNKDVKSLSQLIKVSPGEKLYISIVPQNKEGIKGSYLGKDVIFDQGSSYINTYIKAPLSTGRYVFKTNSSPLTLLIDVTVVNQPVKIKTGFWNWLSGLFK